MPEPFDNLTFDPLEPLPSDLSLSEPDKPSRRFTSMAFLLGTLAWCVVVLFVVGEAFLGRDEHISQEKPDDDGSLHLSMARFQARYLVGSREFLRALSPSAGVQLAGQARALITGPVDQRIRSVILTGELEGPDAAKESLEQLEKLLAEKKVALTPTQEMQREILVRLYSDYARLRFDAPSVTPGEREMLHESMTWFGPLALAPEENPSNEVHAAAIAGAAAAAAQVQPSPDAARRDDVLMPALRVAFATWLAIGGGAAGVFIGFCGLILITILLFLGKLRGGLTCGASPAGVYIETFALWILTFGLMRLALENLPRNEWRFLISSALEICTLVVILWPVLRGVPWRQAMHDMGLTLGRRPLAEPAIGVASYVLGLPLLMVGAFATIFLMTLQHYIAGDGGADDFSIPSGPSHPITGPLLRGDWSVRLQFLFLASVVAPLVEEVMFRGVLYRHLRELTCRSGGLLSVLFSTLFSSFIFAAIHPQGLLAVPALMSLAIGFSLAREWRVTLIPCMVAHGLSNALVLMLNILLFAE